MKEAFLPMNFQNDNFFLKCHLVKLYRTNEKRDTFDQLLYFLSKYAKHHPQKQEEE